MQKYSLYSLVRNSFTRHRNWSPAWINHDLKKSYDVIIIGGGGHGLATAYYLAKDYGVTNIAVLERGWLGGGNVARNTVTIRSNYLRQESIPFFIKSVEMYEGLSNELNFNLMHSRRSMIDIIQTYPKLREITRKMYTMDIFG
ncbi:MAG: FAD-dependent oxidoreductase, partial [Paracoccaceae bacterium]|nr:FAD-dependent oxidoreductase [Paracoccaceae bacterium]